MVIKSLYLPPPPPSPPSTATAIYRETSPFDTPLPHDPIDDPTRWRLSPTTAADATTSEINKTVDAHCRRRHKPLFALTIVDGPSPSSPAAAAGWITCSRGKAMLLNGIKIMVLRGSMVLDYIAYGGEYSGAFIFSSENLNNSRVCRVCKRGVCRM